MSEQTTSPYILAVDDEKEFLLLLDKSLTAKGFIVRTLLNACNFWETVQQRRPDVIFLDIQMQGINGLDLCNQLKQEPSTASIPILIISGHATAAEVAQSCKAEAFLSKPLSTAKIVSVIEEVLA